MKMFKINSSHSIKNILIKFPQLSPLCETIVNILNYRSISYVQGQELQPRIREYFYFINHQGMLFLDDAKMKNFTSCFKDKKFLHFFFTRVKLNNTDHYQNEFPFISLCGRERNFIRCDDVPIVYTHLIKDENGVEKLSFNYGGELLVVDFQPNKIFMSTKSGRVYHPAWEKVGKIGLIRSKLAIDLSKYFEFEELKHDVNYSSSDSADSSGDKGLELSATSSVSPPPTHFTWNGNRYTLDRNWVQDTILNKKL